MKIIHNHFDKNEIEQVGTKFLLGNGFIGYRGTLEEMDAGDKVALTLAGTYDQYEDKWREIVNAPNPFYVLVKADGQRLHITETTPLSHSQQLNMLEGVFSRTTEYEKVTVSSLRFVERNYRDTLATVYTLLAKEDTQIELLAGVDTNVWDLNGPHLYIKQINNEEKIEYLATTNEGKYLAMSLKIASESLSFTNTQKQAIYGKEVTFTLKKGEKVELSIVANVAFGDSEKVSRVSKDSLNEYLKEPLAQRLEEHKKTWKEDWDKANVYLDGDKRAQLALTYSIYHLLILAPRDYLTSIAARGLSGQTYKGAIFWDTEIFLLPFFTLTDPQVARNLIEYRLNALIGAQTKAKEFGYEGAFYAWEGQEQGKEACSLYNIHDAKTGEPVRTYFADRQIHISADVAYGLLMYYKYTQDESILSEKYFEVLKEIIVFYQSYATLENDGKYHFNGVIGPDEYHELVDDNAFTNYMIYAVGKMIYELSLQKCPENISKEKLEQFKQFIDRIYLPLPNEEGVIEQFAGYFDLEDVTPKELHQRKTTPNEYLGGVEGVATPTRVIKQADVVTLLVLLPEYFSEEVKKANFLFYEPYTEHGSSLSACMYAILGLQVGETNKAYENFLRSAEVDLNMKSKRYAGATYIGGSHPASAGGAYLTAILGFAGMKFGNEITFEPTFAGDINGLSFKYILKGINHKVEIDKNKQVRKQVIK